MTEWRHRGIEECLQPLALGTLPKLQTSEYRASGSYPIIDQGQRLITGWTDDSRGLISSCLPVVVFGDHTRIFKYVDFPFVRGADGTHILKPAADIHPRFFYYACKAVDLPSRGYNRHYQAFKSRVISLPCWREQESIAAALQMVERAVFLAEEQAGIAGVLKHAAMLALFTRGLRGGAQKETEIGSLPESWDVVPFDAALRITQGQVDPRVEPYASMLHIGPENVEPGSGRLLGCRTARELGLISGKYAFSRGDIVYSKIRPYLNKVALPTFDGLCSADMYPLRNTCHFERNFLFHFLLSELFLLQVVPHQTRTGIPKVNREQLSSTRIPLPSTDEQREIAIILDSIDRKIDLHRRKRALLDELFKILLHKLMSGEIRVADLDLAALDPRQPVEAAA